MRTANLSPMQRLWVVGGGVVALLLVAIGYLFFISPQRSETADVNARISSAQSQNETLTAKLVTLRQQNEHLAQYRSAAAQAELALPSTSGLSDFLRTLQSIGSATLTHVSSLTVGAPVDVTSVAAGTGPTTPGAAPATPSPASTAPPAAQAGGPAAGGTAAPTAGGVYGLPISAQVTGSDSALTKFLDQLQTVQPRAVLITQITESTAQTADQSSPRGQTTLQLSMQAFVAPSSAAESNQLAAAAAGK